MLKGKIVSKLIGFSSTLEQIAKMEDDEEKEVRETLRGIKTRK